MQCVNHPAEAATAICTRCDKLLCAACAHDHKGKNFCADCAEYLGQRAQQRQQTAAPPAMATGPAPVYDGPPPGAEAPPQDIYQGPPPPVASPPPVAPPVAAPQAPAANPYQSPAPTTPQAPAANPYQSPAPAAPQAPAANPYQSPAPAAPQAPAANPYQSPAPAAPQAPAGNPYQSVAPAPITAALPVSSQQSPSAGGLGAVPPPLPSSGGMPQGPPPGDVYQGPPPGDVYQEPAPGDVYQGPPSGDVYQGPPADGVYQGPPAGSTYRGPKEGGATLPIPEAEGSTGRAVAYAAGFGLLAVLVWYGFSESTSGLMKAPLIGAFLGLIIGHSAVRGAGRGGSDIATLSVALTGVALILGEVLIGYQPERMYISMGFWEWILYLISLYEGWNVPASRA